MASSGRKSCHALLIKLYEQIIKLCQLSIKQLICLQRVIKSSNTTEKYQKTLQADNMNVLN